VLKHRGVTGFKSGNGLIDISRFFTFLSRNDSTWPLPHAGSHAYRIIMYKSIVKILITIYPALAFSEDIFLNNAAQHASLSLDEINVTATRTPISTKTVTGDITVIERDEIERLSGGAIIDLLRLQPGLQILANGGMGNTSSVFMRGTNSNQLVVLIDGIRINSATTGTTAFENLPLALIDHIEILRGPASSLYGADAIGGVIQIFTRRGNSDKISFFGSAGAGSYDTYTGNAGFNAKYQALQYGAQINSIDTRGISAKKGPITRVDRDRDGYYNLSGSAYATLTLAEGHSIDLNYMESDGKNHYDSGSDNYTTMNQQAYSIALKNRFNGNWLSTLKYGIGRDQSSDFGGPGSTSKFETEQNQITWQHDFTLPIGVATFAYDRLEQDVLTSNNGIPSINRSRNNDSFTLGYNGQYEAHSAQLSVREDHNTQYGSFTTGGLGYGYTISPEWRVTAQYGSAFRAPTFNQLYFANFGDPNLEPEKSDNLEASLRYQNNFFLAKLTAFDNHIRDLIEFSGPVTVGCNRAGRCPINIGKVEIQGLTAEAVLNLNQEWQLSGNLTIQSPQNEITDKLLARRSQRYGNLVLQYRSGDWDWSAEVSASSERYDNAANTITLSGYALINSTLAYKLTKNLKFQARANNILDKDYALAAATPPVYYNTMGTNVFVSLIYDMK
jgi:vitamin B12 transporter